MKLAILGGSFNPIHIGHLALANSVKDELGYDKIALVPAYISPFKKNLTGSSNWASADDRLKMLELATRNCKHIYCEPYELYKQGISYTIDTINFLYYKFSSQGINKLEGKIGLIIGDDLTLSFPLWHNADKILKKTEIIVGQRDSSKEQTLPFPHYELKNTILPISSTQIRNAIKEGKEFKQFLPPEVFEYIKTNSLYT